MTRFTDQSEVAQRSKQALLVWCVFFVLAIVFNGTIPFLLGVDLHAWTTSTSKSILFGFIFYSVIFLAVPLVLIKGWETVRQPAFLLPLCIAMVAITLGNTVRGIMIIAILVLAYLHWRFDLSDYGIRFGSWKGDLSAITLMGLLGFVPVLLRSSAHSFSFGPALLTALERLFVNPASSVENLFYFGFITERLSYTAGKWLTPPLVGLMYMAHEMTNPEYWFGGMNFVLIFVGVAIWAAIYLWRRSVVVIWLGDGLYRLAGTLF